MTKSLTLADMIEERERLDHAIAAEQHRRQTVAAPGWAKFLMARIDGSYMASDGRRLCYPDPNGTNGHSYLYGAPHYISLDGGSGPVLRAVLQALIDLEDARARGEIDDEVAK